MYDYSFLLNTKIKRIWERVGIKRRAGVVVPLFSVYSKKSMGVGEIPDLKLVIDWCKKINLSILQLLPLNDTGNIFAPYSAISSFALDPMYLRIDDLYNADLKPFRQKINQLKSKYKLKSGRVNYKCKDEKLSLIFEIYKNSHIDFSFFTKFKEDNSYWLKDYSLYKSFTEYLSSDWENWDEKYIFRYESTLIEAEYVLKERIDYHNWLQWQLYLQFRDLKKYAEENGILIMSDLPLLVARESCDVWAYKKYFHLHLSSGAPPDMYFAFGQKWGNPVYNWEQIASDSFIYLKERLKYASNFSDMYRIDHFIGLFRIWSIEMNDKSNLAAMNGRFIPSDENIWEAHARVILDAMISASDMLPCAEDLGTIPQCSFRTLDEYGIPGVDFARYKRKNFEFISPSDYRYNSISVISTHDSTLFCNWYKYEAGTIDEKLFQHLCKKNNLTGQKYTEIRAKLFDKGKSLNGRLKWSNKITSVDILLFILGLKYEEAHEFIYLYLDTFNEKQKVLQWLFGKNYSSQKPTTGIICKALEKIYESSSIFCCNLINEYLCLDKILLKKMNKWNYRINTPGTISKKNWSILLPLNLDKLQKLKINNDIKLLAEKYNRI